MSTAETEILNRLEKALELMLLGALGDARAALDAIDPSNCLPISQLIAKTSLLVERISESFAAKESALASVQLSMLELETVQEELRHDRFLLRTVIDHLPDAVYAKDVQGRKTLTNLADAHVLGYDCELEVLGKTDLELLVAQEAQGPSTDDRQVLETGASILNKEESFINRRGQKIWLQTSKLPLQNERRQIVGLVGIGHNITERKAAEAERARMELQLRQSQKLEAIGQLAAGIAHEINTPTQYVGDNVHFFKKAFADLDRVLEAHTRLVAKAKKSGITPEAAAEILNGSGNVRVDFLRQEIPKAISDALEGVDRVTQIVRAMKEFSHPGTEEKRPVDLNRAIESTLTVSRSEWKYVAEMVTNFAPNLPPVPCLPGEFNQVVLNLVVNAAHAIADVVGHGSRGKGTITVSTQLAGSWAEIRVQDSGAGIPAHIQDRIFEPFFTTKPAGIGSGQGLAISRSVIVDRHRGSIRFESEPGRGTVFIIQLPLHLQPGGVCRETHAISR